MSFPAEKKNQPAYNVPIIREGCWLKANDGRVWLEHMLYIFRHVEAATLSGGEPFPQWLLEWFRDNNSFYWIVRDYVYLHRMLFGQAAADEVVRKINPAVFEGLSKGTGDRAAWEAGRPW